MTKAIHFPLHIILIQSFLSILRSEIAWPIYPCSRTLTISLGYYHCGYCYHTNLKMQCFKTTINANEISSHHNVLGFILWHYYTNVIIYSSTLSSNCAK